MSRPHVALILLVLWVSSSLCMLCWPLLYLLRGREVVRVATQAVNACLGGYARESLSSRMGRTGDYPRLAAWINRADPGHTYRAAHSESGIVAALLRDGR
ncbi:MAG: hypothetical protein IT531_00125 [Burkholderiales bacterium]|nr:hypothetical protein [Burkholderiales bacterium]